LSAKVDIIFHSGVTKIGDTAVTKISDTAVTKIGDTGRFLMY